MFSTKRTRIVAVATLLLVAVHVLPTSEAPTRQSSTGTGSSRTSGSGVFDGPCNTELNEREINALIDETEGGLHGLINVLQGVQVWNLRATVGVYGTIETIFGGMLNVNGTCTRLASDYGSAIATGVSYLQKFVQPVGDALTGETVREVILHEPGFAREFSIARGNLSTAAKGIYELVKGNRNIHECVLPSLPLETHLTILKPHPPPNVSDPSYRDIVVDGIANELVKLAADLIIALTCFFDN